MAVIPAIAISELRTYFLNTWCSQGLFQNTRGLIENNNNNNNNKQQQQQQQNLPHISAKQ